MADDVPTTGADTSQIPALYDRECDTSGTEAEERSSGRAVHVKGTAALGYFEVTHDIRHWCRAEVFSKVGLRTPVLCRLSAAGGQSDLPDTVRDFRGFAVRHYTASGLWDMVGHDTPVFFIRNPVLFPSFIHTQRRDPATHQKDPVLFWDFITLQQETMHQVSLLFSDRGTPDGYRHMNGYGSHAFQLINADGQHVWAKFHYKTDQGIRNLSAARAAELASSNPDYCCRDLNDAIASGRPPSWTLHVQVMTPSEAAGCAFDPFDLTRVWPHAEFPLHEVGRLVLDRVPTDEVTQVEQAAFAPSNMPDGIEPSPDPMLKARLFSYSDTQQHRLGPQYSELPANRPDGTQSRQEATDVTEKDDDDTDGCNRPQDGGDVTGERDVQPCSEEQQEDFSQIRAFWQRVLSKEERLSLADNMGVHACDAPVFIQARIVGNWRLVCEDFGDHILTALLRHNTAEKATELSSFLDAAEDDAGDADEDDDYPAGKDPPC